MRDVDLSADAEYANASTGPLFSQDENGALIVVNSDEPASSDEDAEDAEPESESDALDAQAPHDGI